MYGHMNVKFPQKIPNIQIWKAATMCPDLMGNQSEACKRSCRFGFDIGPVITDQDVDFNP